ncbi:TIGR03943 family protein [Candidatus Peregrinibacteria bacterium]|nr:TIGR03943 family protein [Candidatus Peregrinibacteria bacterium]
MKKIFLAIIFLTISVWLIRLYFIGNLMNYIVPKYSIIVLTAAIIIGFFGILIMIYSKQFKAINKNISWGSLLLLIVPCILGLTVSPAPLSSVAAFNKGIQTDISTVKISTPANFSIDSKQRSFAEWISFLESTTNPEDYIGKEVKITGFVLKNDELENNEFYLARFVMRCCAADAKPVGLKVISDKEITWQNDDWLEIKGVFQNSIDDKKSPEIKLSNAMVVSIPDNPYIN